MCINAPCRFLQAGRIQGFQKIVFMWSETDGSSAPWAEDTRNKTQTRVLAPAQLGAATLKCHGAFSHRAAAAPVGC